MQKYLQRLCTMFTTNLLVTTTSYKLTKMKSITTKDLKEKVGKLATKALRNADKVPCVLYGGENPIHFSAKELDFKISLPPNAHTVEINLDGGEKINAILQDIQFHPVSDKILHVISIRFLTTNLLPWKFHCF